MMIIDMWCRMWCRVQDIAFWVDDKTHSAYAGHFVTRLIEKVTPNDW